MTCLGRTRKGARCANAAIIGGSLCLQHAPEMAAARAARNRKGGLSRQGALNTRRPAAAVGDPSPPLRTVRDVQALLERALADVLRLENSNSRARSLAALALSALRCIETAVLEERLEALERRAHEPMPRLAEVTNGARS